MFKRACIKLRIIVPILVILLLYTGGILLLERRIEKKLTSIRINYEQPLPYNSFLSMILFGDTRSSLMMNRGYTIINDNEGIEDFSALIRKMRYQVLMVFGFLIVVGITLALLIARSISKPIIELANASNDIANGNINVDIDTPQCGELKTLTESFRNIQQGLMEFKEEKSRSEEVAITKHLAAGIAHEIKNPINTVGLIADYMQTNLSPDDPGKRYEFYKLSENMKNELKRINRIVEGFLRLTKPDVYHFQKENINLIIKESISAFEPEIVKQGIRLSLNLKDKLPLIEVDRDKLNQVFSNLFINAVEAMPRGGEIKIFTETINENRIRIEITDTGIGIPQEDKGKIFSPYYSTKKQGFGLGLSLIHSIIQKHKGKISVNSAKGEGACFEILLPVNIKNE
ncbi:MAG: HAMP domain-containing protein [Spirochaetota bacterium]|nr:MAG: HAMP domain-containing protein [Spirochaetota bacterium]